MKRNKKFLVLAIVISGVIVLANCHRHRHDPESFLQRVDCWVEDLELTEDQSAKYQGIRARLKADLEARRAERKTTMNNLKTEFDKNDPNVNSAAGDIKKQIAAMSGTFDRGPDYFLEFYAILNPEQQKQVNEDIRKKLNRYHRWHN